MSLLPCKKCGCQQKKRAYKCIACGKILPNSSRKEKILYGFLVYITLGMLMSFGQDHSTNAQTPQPQVMPSAKTQKTLEYLKSLKWVKDAIHQDFATVQWQIGIIDDGRNPTWAAESICDMLSLRGLVNSDTNVRIVDIEKVSRGQSFRKASLVRINCFSREAGYP